MPFESKAQMRKFFAMEERGEIPKGTAQRWADETPSTKKLPERKKKQQQKHAGLDPLHQAYLEGFLRALKEE